MSAEDGVEGVWRVCLRAGRITLKVHTYLFEISIFLCTARALIYYSL